MSWFVHHVNLMTFDLDKSIAFFDQVFGMENVEPPYGEHYTYRRRVGWFDNGPGTTQVHLSPPDPNFAAKHGIHVNPTIGGHVAIQVDDIHRAKAQLDALGIYASPPQPFAVEGHLQMYSLDPAGNGIEIIQAT